MPNQRYPLDTLSQRILEENYEKEMREMIKKYFQYESSQNPLLTNNFVYRDPDSFILPRINPVYTKPVNNYRVSSRLQCNQNSYVGSQMQRNLLADSSISLPQLNEEKYLYLIPQKSRSFKPNVISDNFYRRNGINF